MTYDDLMTAVLHGRDAEKEQQALERITAFVNEMHTRSYETGLPMSVELLSAFQGFVSNYTDAPESTYDQWALAFTYWQKAAEETVSSKERFEQGLAEAKARALNLAPFNVARYRLTQETFERVPQEFWTMKPSGV